MTFSAHYATVYDATSLCRRGDQSAHVSVMCVAGKASRARARQEQTIVGIGTRKCGRFPEDSQISELTVPTPHQSWYNSHPLVQRPRYGGRSGNGLDTA